MSFIKISLVLLLFLFSFRSVSGGSEHFYIHYRWYGLSSETIGYQMYIIQRYYHRQKLA